MGKKEITSKLTLRKGKEILVRYGMGASSKAILRVHLGSKEMIPDYPYDSGDFMRCLGLVRVFNIDINIMKGHYIWNRIIKEWDNLVTLCLKDDLYRVSYLLQEITRKPKTSVEIVEEANIILSINRAEPTEGCETKIKLLKNVYKPEKDLPESN